MKKFKVLLIVMLLIIIIGCNNSKFDNTNTDQKDVSKTSEKSQTSFNAKKLIIYNKGYTLLDAMPLECISSTKFR